MSDLTEVIRQLGGGPGAVMIVAVSLFAWHVLNWWREDTKEHNAQLREVSKEATEGLHASAAAIRSLTEEVKRGS